MNDPEPGMFELMRRHRRYLAPLWCLILTMMLAVVSGDVFGKSFDPTPWIYVVFLPLFLWAFFSFMVFRRRVRLTPVTSFVIWTVPTMALWCGFVFLRAIVLTLLDRPLD